MNEFLEQFIIEARELIQLATRDLLVLEQNPTDRAGLDSVFRAFHTLKGGAGIVDFVAFAELAHAVEDMLSNARTGNNPFSKALVDACLSSLDQMALWLDAAEAQDEFPADAQTAAHSLIAEFTSIARPVSAPVNQPQPPAPGDAALPPYAVEVLKAQIDLLALPADEGSAGRNGAAMRVIDQILRYFTVPMMADAEVRGVNIAPAVATMPNDARAEAPRAQRIDTTRIDGIVKLAGALTVVKNTIGHALELAGGVNDEKILHQAMLAPHAQLDRLTTELLRAALAARVLPLRQVFQRFPRLVRQMAESLDKPIRLVTDGEATEADRTVVEALFEPILHVLRNAADHGIEPRGQREAAGKPFPAILTLSARREGEHVVIEINDDGKGIDIAAIRATAIKNGLIPPETAASLSEQEVLNLIFTPGFSTASNVTAISGRGVGMDAVRATVEQIGGHVSIGTVFGAGTSVKFNLPFSVMLTKVLTVEAAGQVFGVPFEAVVEMRQIHPAEVFAVGVARTVAFRGDNIPLIDLAISLNLTVTRNDAGVIHAVIVDILGEYAAITIDRFGRQLEILLKPLGGILMGMKGIAGTSLLGDGRVLIVLELHDLLQ